jgi:hypothetical protein
MPEIIETQEQEETATIEGIVQSPAQKQQFFRTLSGACDFISGFQIYPANVNYVNGAFVVTYNNQEV